MPRTLIYSTYIKYSRLLITHYSSLLATTKVRHRDLVTIVRSRDSDVVKFIGRIVIRRSNFQKANQIASSRNISPKTSFKNSQSELVSQHKIF